MATQVTAEHPTLERINAYREFQRAEGIPVVRGFAAASAANRSSNRARSSSAPPGLTRNRLMNTSGSDIFDLPAPRMPAEGKSPADSSGILSAMSYTDHNPAAEAVPIRICTRVR